MKGIIITKKHLTFFITFLFLLRCLTFNGFGISSTISTVADEYSIIEKDTNSGKIRKRVLSSYSISKSKINSIDEKVSTYSIIDDDNREEVSNTTKYPYSAIAPIKIEWGILNVTYGTAWMVSKNVALTAGHCIYDVNKDVWAKKITIYPAKNGATSLNNPYGSASSKKLVITENYMNTKSPECDWGVIILSEDIGLQTGFIPFTHPSDEQLRNATIEISGYPFGNGLFHDYKQVTMIGTVSTFSTRKLYYNIDTTEGQSGSPILGPNNIAYGIHTHGHETFNSGVRITDTMYNAINIQISENS